MELTISCIAIILSLISLLINIFDREDQKKEKISQKINSTLEKLHIIKRNNSANIISMKTYIIFIKMQKETDFKDEFYNQVVDLYNSYKSDIKSIDLAIGLLMKIDVKKNGYKNAIDYFHEINKKIISLEANYDILAQDFKYIQKEGEDLFQENA